MVAIRKKVIIPTVLVTLCSLFFLFFMTTNHRLRMMTNYAISSFISVKRNASSNSYKTSKIKHVYNYSKILAHYALSNRNDSTLHHLKINNLNLTFYKHWDLLHLYKEIFDENIYYFSSEKKEPFIIDAGSNIGMMTLYQKQMYPHARIIAFEPGETTFSVLKQNVEKNKLKNITLVNKALYDRDGTLTFYSEGPGSVSATLVNGAILEAKHSFQINATKLSHYIDQKVDFLKMDIEGAELNVLHELHETKKLSMVQKMIIECHPHNKEPFMLGKILEILAQNNFRYAIQNDLKAPFNKNYFNKPFLIYASQK